MIGKREGRTCGKRNKKKLSGRVSPPWPENRLLPKKRGYTQEQLADRAECSWSFLSQLEANNGDRIHAPSLYTLFVLQEPWKFPSLNCLRNNGLPPGLGGNLCAAAPFGVLRGLLAADSNAAQSGRHCRLLQGLSKQLQKNSINNGRQCAEHDHRSGHGKHFCRHAGDKSLALKSMAGETTAFAKPVIGTRVPAPPKRASLL